MKNNNIVLGGFILIVILLSSCTSKEDKTISRNNPKSVAIISDEQILEKDIAVASDEKISEIIVPKLNSSGTEIKEIFVGSEKRGSYNPFRTGPIELNSNEWLANGPYDGLKIAGEESNPMYADPYSYWKDNLDSHTSIKSGALINFVFEGKNTSIELGGSGIMEVVSFNNQDNGRIIKKIIVQGQKQYYPLDNTYMTTYQNNPKRKYLFLRFSKGVDIYSFKVE